ncbi:hypothetical protein [Paracoccus salsus]|uniref:hypothetical protein n=1 Tax=Paracoccus salsus TaxID=2911061 RepID=UPI001F1B8100|nr:hypothetical protein [Paracoccus salsus]MCF3974826.1 hypothetical protein [Paracoccus salsus]
MIIERAIGRISNRTMNDLDEYMTSFAPGQHAAFRVDGQAFPELHSDEALALLAAQFPESELRILDREDGPSDPR